MAQRLGVLLADDRVRLRDVDASDLVVEPREDSVWMEHLLRYRTETLLARPSPTRSQSQEIWAGIAREMAATPATSETRAAGEARSRTDRAPRRSRSTLPMRVQWAAFALLVLGAIGVTWFVLQPDPLQEILVAQSGAQVQTLTTADGSTIQLRPNSTLHRVQVAGGDRYRLEGEAQFSVPPRSNTPFQVDAGTARVTVLGTRFTVRTWTPEPQVYLAEGRVAVSHTPSARSDTLRPGQQARVTEDAIDVSEADPAGFISWMEKQLVFRRRTAASIARELQQHYDVSLHLPDSVQQETLSGELALGSRDETLADFGAVLGGSFEAAEDGAYRFVPSK
mgnify:CR=1 FL=1